MSSVRVALRRRGWVVPICVAVGTVVAVIVSRQAKPMYRSTSSVVVYRSGSEAASVAATTYATLIRTDGAVIRSVARALGYSPSLAASRLGADQLPGTSMIQITYDDPSPRRSQLGDTAAESAVTSAPPVTPAIPNGSLRIVSDPATPSEVSDPLADGPIPIGLTLGLMVGLGIMLAWERMDPHADDVRSLERDVGLPVTLIGERSADQMEFEAVQFRWFQLSDARDPAHTKVVAVTASGGVATLTMPAPAVDMARQVTSLVAHGPSQSGHDGSAVLKADLVVVATTKGARLSALQSRIESLRRLGIEPRWVLLVGSSG